MHEIHWTREFGPPCHSPFPQSHPASGNCYHSRARTVVTGIKAWYGLDGSAANDVVLQRLMLYCSGLHNTRGCCLQHVLLGTPCLPLREVGAVAGIWTREFIFGGESGRKSGLTRLVMTIECAVVWLG